MAPPLKSKPKYEFVKVFQMVVGCDLIGSKMSMAASKNLLLLKEDDGIRCYSKATDKLMKIPDTNIKGMQLFITDEQRAEYLELMK